MWPPYLEEIDCFLRRESQQQQQQFGYQILDEGKQQESAGAEAPKLSFDVALDTDDLGGISKDIKPQQVRPQRKITFQECKSLLKKKLTKNRHSKWIQKQWEKHRVNLKDKLVARGGFLLGTRQPASANSQPRGNTSSCLPLAYSFISFKTGISTVDSKTQLLPAECIQAWRRWKSGKSTLLLRRPREAGESHSATSAGLIIVDEQEQEQLVKDSTTASPGHPDQPAVPPKQMPATVQKPEVPAVSPVQKLEEPAVCPVQKPEAPAVSPDQEQEHNMSSSNEAHARTDVSFKAAEEEGPLRMSQGELADENACGVSDPSTSPSEHQQPQTEDSRNVDEEKALRNVPEQSLAGLELSRLDRMMRSGGGRDIYRPRKTNISPSSSPPSSSLMTAEVTKYLLFRELLRGMPSAAATGDDCSTTSSSSFTQEPCADQAAARKAIGDVLSPYRTLFEDRNKELLHELLSSLSEEAQLIKQAWTCKLDDTGASQELVSGGEAAEAGGSSVSETGASKMTEKVSLFLSLKDGKIQLKNKQPQREQLQHDCLSNVVKSHGMSTGFYMKITQEELLKKLPPKKIRSSKSRPPFMGRSKTPMY